MERITKEELRSTLEDLDEEIREIEVDKFNSGTEYLQGKRDQILELLGGRPEDMNPPKVEVVYNYIPDSAWSKNKAHDVEVYQNDLKIRSVSDTNKRNILRTLKNDNILSKDQLETLDRAMSKRKKVLIDGEGVAINYKKESLDHEISFDT